MLHLMSKSLVHMADTSKKSDSDKYVSVWLVGDLNRLWSHREARAGYWPHHLHPNVSSEQCYGLKELQ